MATPGDETRWRVYCALRDGHSHTSAARLLGITRPTVDHHAAQLVAAGRLSRAVKAHGKAAEYRRGGRAMLYEAQKLAKKGDREGRAAPVIGSDARVHRGEFKVRVAPYGAHRQEPPFSKEWHANGVRFREWWHDLANGRQVRVRECRGEHNCSLILQPEEERTHGPAETEALERAWALRVDEAMSDLAAMYGYQPAGRIERSTPIEYEWEAPALAKGVRAKARDGQVWTDGSTGPASIETDSRTVAVAVAGLPEHMARDAEDKRTLAARLDALQQQAERFGAASLIDNPALLEPVVRVLELHGDALRDLLGVQA